MAPPKGKFARPLAAFVEPLIAPALRQQGFGETAIVTRWRQIAGARIADFAEPMTLRWTRSGAATPEPATLVLRVESGFALEMQHLAPILIERINAHLGWRCVGAIALRQGPLQRPGPPPRPPPPDAEAVAGARRAVAGIEDEALRAALERLGAAVLARARR